MYVRLSSKLDTDGNLPVPIYEGVNLTSNVPSTDTIPEPSKLDVDLISLLPLTENNSCLSSELNVTASAAPENFLRDPVPNSCTRVRCVVKLRNGRIPSVAILGT